MTTAPPGRRRRCAPAVYDRALLQMLIEREQRHLDASTPESARMYRRADQVLVGGVASSFQRRVPWPFYLARGEGAVVWDLDGRQMVDFHNGFGSMVQGHANPSIAAAVGRQVSKGSHFAAPTEDAVVVAEELARRFGLPKWRYTNSGSESTMDAIRIARGFTGRDTVMKTVGSYHGHHDTVMVATGGDRDVPDDRGNWPSVAYGAGIPPSVAELTVAVPFNDPDALERRVDELARESRKPACLIMEPAMMLGMILPEPGYLEAVREITRRRGIVLIFDEVKTGLAVAAGGVVERFGVRPDLVTLAKALGGGLPSGAIGGTEEVMSVVEDGSVYQVGTYNGNALTVAAARASLFEVLTPDAYAHLERLNRRMIDGCQRVLDEHGMTGYALGIGARGCVTLSPTRITDYATLRATQDMDLLRLTWLHAVNSGVFITPARPEQWTLSIAHSDEHVDTYVGFLDRLLNDLEGLVAAEVNPVTPVSKLGTGPPSSTGETMSSTIPATATTAGVRLHPEAERRYRERTRRSLELLEQTKPLIPTGHAGGMWYQLPYPVLLERAQGARVWDVDGNRYLDMRIGDWVMALGHRNEAVRDAIVEQLDRAAQLGCPEWGLAHRMASLLIERMPSIERVRFLASGTESNLMALRLARAYTGRTKLAKAQGSYHGIADVLVVGDSSISFDAAGVPAGVTPGVAQDVVEFPFNDPDGAESVLEREGADLAAVLVEPIMGAAGMVPATTEFLQRLREVTARLGIVLIFDEVVTFPIAYGGAQAYHGVTPDLTVMSKSIGGGLPQAAVGGSAEIMGLLDPYLHDGRAPVLAASTFGGNVTALAAGIAAIEQLTPEVHARVQAVGERMRRGIDEIGEKYGIPLHATGFGHLYGMHWAPERVVDYRTRMLDDNEKLANIMLGLLNESVYQFSFGTLLLSAAHGDEEIDEFLAALERALHAVDLVS